MKESVESSKLMNANWSVLAVFDLLISTPPAKPVSCDVAPLFTCINLSSDVTVPTSNVIDEPETVKLPSTVKLPVI